MQELDTQVNHEVVVILLNKIIKALSVKDEPLESIKIDNLDEVQAALQNCANKQTKSLTDSLTGIKATTDQQTKVIDEILNSSDKQNEIINQILVELKKSLTDNFASVYVKKPREQVEILNLDEIPTSQTITNLSELEPYFNKLGESLRVDVAAPYINLPAPIVNVPASIVNVPEVDLTPIVEELDRQLNKIRTNSVARPLAVRLSDGQEWLKEIKTITEKAQQAFMASSGPTVIKSADGGLINPATVEGQAFGKIVPASYDYISMSPAASPTTVLYKKNGITIATLTIAYSGTDISSITRT